MVSVSIKMDSIALSVIDSEPTEIGYLCLKDIEVSLERTRAMVSTAATVQVMQVSNQLLNPVFQVMFFSRQRGNMAGGHRLLLPGLHQRGNNYPALHIFTQQRYHQFSRISRSGGPDSATGDNDSNLLYFDIASLWIAPVELDVDEEAFVRMMRYVQDVRYTINNLESGTLRFNVKAKLLLAQQRGNKSWGVMDPREVSLSLQELLTAGKRYVHRFHY